MFVRYAFLADTVLKDTSGKISAIGIFDNIIAQGFPAVQHDMTLVINLEATINEKGKHDISVEIRDVDSNRLYKLDQSIILGDSLVTHGILRQGVLIRMLDMTFPRKGQYEFVVFGDNRFLVRIPFMVQKIDIKEAGAG